MSKQNITFIRLENLLLDKENPRLPSTFKKNNIDQNKIIDWMLEDASIIELMLAIGQAGFFIGEALLVVADGQGKYITIEGNRRLTSVMLLNNPTLASIHKKKIEKVLEETVNRPEEIPCIIFPTRDEINKYLGYRHVTGVKSWGILQKARYLKQLSETYNKDMSFAAKCRQLAKSIGSRSDYVRKLLIAYGVYEIIEDNGFFNVKNLDESTIFFNYYADSLDKENIKKFIGVDVDLTDPLSGVNQKNIAELTRWFFEKNEHNKSRVIGDSKNLMMLDKVLSDEEALEYFRSGSGSIYEAYNLVAISASTFYSEIDNSLAALKRANSIIYNIGDDLGSVKVKLKEIYELSKGLNSIIKSREDDRWDD